MSTDSRPGARLLRTERDELLPLLRATPAAAFDTPTTLPGWSVRDVLAHCGSALIRVATGDLHDFSPASNEQDVAPRREWPLEDVLAELADGYERACPVIEAAGGKLDLLALGEWVHGGDVREAIGAPEPYAGAGIEDALALLVPFAERREIPEIEVRLPGGNTLLLGVPAGGRERAGLRTDEATLIRLCAGRPANPERYELSGARPEELVIFG